jgi:hypothetical protein
LTGTSFNDNNNNNVFDAGDTLQSISFIDPLGNSCLLLPQPCPPFPMNGALTTTDLLGTFTLNGVSFMDVTDYFTDASDIWGFPPPNGLNLNAANTEVLIDALVVESPIPEPTSLSLLAAGLIGSVLIRRRRNEREEIEAPGT